MAITQVRSILLVAGLAIVLSGCAQSDLTPLASSTPSSSPKAEPSASPSVAPSASPSATPTPTPSPTTVADLVIAPEGLGPILIGAAPEASGLMSYDPAWCTPEEDPGYYGYAPGDPAAGRWYQSFDTSPDAVNAFGIGVLDGTIAYFDIRSEALRTSKGVGLGSTLDELTAAYPDLKSQIPGRVTTTYYITTDSGRISFDVPSSSDDRLAGTVQVLLIHAAGDRQIESWYGTDAGALSCI